MGTWQLDTIRRDKVIEKCCLACSHWDVCKWRISICAIFIERDAMPLDAGYQINNIEWQKERKELYELIGKKCSYFSEKVQVDVEEVRNREKYYVEAIRNLIKQVKSREIKAQLENKQISAAEYEKEISKHPDKYVIRLKNNLSQEDLSAIVQIVKALGIKFSVDEVADIFGVSHKEMNQVL